MNVNMKWIQRTTVVMLTAAMLGTAVFAQSSPDTGEKDDAAAALARLSDQINIMRVLVTKAINEGPFADRYQKAAEESAAKAKEDLARQLEAEAAKSPQGAPSRVRDLYSRLTYMSSRSPFTSHTRGFYASGVGVMFTTEIDAPVRQIQVEPGEEPQQASPDDEWVEAAAEARGGRSYREAALAELRAAGESEKPQTRWEIDPAYIDDAIAGVTEKIASYGMRVTELPDNESFIVAMRFEPNYSSASWPSVVSVGEGDDIPTVYYTASGLGRSARTAATWHVVVQIPKSLVAQHESGAISLQQMRQSATVTKVPSSRSSDSFFGSVTLPGVAPTVVSPPSPPRGVSSGSGSSR